MALPKLTAPKYELTIPSTKKTVGFRPYLVKEEKILMIAMESEDDNQMTVAIKQIIDACTFNELDVNKLAMFDIEYIFAKLRAKSVGENVNVKLPCESCEHSNTVSINLETEIQVSEGAEENIKLTDDTGLIMKYPSMADYQDMQNSKESDIDKIFIMITLSINSIYSGDELFDAKSHSRAELIEFIDSLNADQFKKIRNFLDKIPVAYVNAKFKCESCNHENNIELKGLKNFFG
jgi:hypothetical protein